MSHWSTLVGAGDDVVGDIFTNEIQSREIVTDAACRERKAGNHLAQFHHPVIAEIRIVGHL